MRLEIGACMLPKKDRGEDAYFVSSDGRAIGLADGMFKNIAQSWGY